MPHRPFPKVKSVIIRGPTVYHPPFHRHFSQITTLELDLENDSLTAPQAVAGLEYLQDLSIVFAKQDQYISGQGILKIANSCPGLRKLQISLYSIHIEWPWSQDITDQVMSAVFRALPNLELLHLGFVNTQLTDSSFVSLGLHCKSISECKITADIDF